MKSGGKAALAGLGLLGALLLMSSGKKSSVSSIPLSNDIRTRLLEIALGEVGHTGGDKYWADVNPSFVHSHEDWCGAFALWALHQVGLAKDRHWIMGRGFILTAPFNLPTTHDPQPGDIIYVDQPFQHQALVLSASGPSVQTINGNSTGNAVRIGSHLKSAPGTLFYSIEPLIHQAQQGLPNA